MWDELQRDILSALGHAPLVLAPRELPDDPLLHALLRASAHDADSAGLDEVLRSLPPMASLRGNVAAKRALWPQLRRFRHPDA